MKPLLILLLKLELKCKCEKCIVLLYLSVVGEKHIPELYLAHRCCLAIIGARLKCLKASVCFKLSLWNCWSGSESLCVSHYPRLKSSCGDCKVTHTPHCIVSIKTQVDILNKTSSIPHEDPRFCNSWFITSPVAVRWMLSVPQNPPTENNGFGCNGVQSCSRFLVPLVFAS